MKKGLLMTMLTLILVFTSCNGSGNTVVANKEQTTNTEAVVFTDSMEEEILQESTGTVEELAETEAAEAVEELTETESLEVAEESTGTESIGTESTEDVAREDVTVTAMSMMKYAKSEVNVRKGPSVDYEKVGTLTRNQEVKVTGQASTGWYRIEWNGEVAFVSNHYLVDDRVVLAQTKPIPSESTGATKPTSDSIPQTGNEPVVLAPIPTPEPSPAPNPIPESNPVPETETMPRMLTVYVDTYTYFLKEDGSGEWDEPTYVGAGSTVALEGTMVDPRAVCMASSDPNVSYVGDMFEACEGVRGVLRVYYNYKRSEY